jgi:hypothetical protein
VARTHLRRAMRLPFALQLARMAAPAVLLTALGVGVAVAVILRDGGQVVYPPTASVDSTLSASDVRGRKVNRHIARTPIPSLATPKPKSSAADRMISDSTVGWDIAQWVRANAKDLGAAEVIYRPHIWTVQRRSKGWRPMSDCGSPTANHMDQVHVPVYGNSGTA